MIIALHTDEGIDTTPSMKDLLNELIVDPKIPAEVRQAFKQMAGDINDDDNDTEEAEISDEDYEDVVGN